MDELELFDTVEDMLGGVVMALGGPKKVGSRLWPDLPVERAAQNVRDRLNADRREMFSPQQMVFLLKEAREAGYHAGMRWLSCECGYTGTRPAERDAQKAELQRQFVRAVDVVQRLGKQLEKLGAD